MDELRTVRAVAAAWRKWSNEPDFPFTRDHCINGTRIVTLALSQLGVKAKPVSVSLALFNRSAWDLFQANVPLAEWPDHAWSLGVGPGHRTGDTGKWNGHLVCEGDDWTLDISAGQFNRPGRMVMPGPRLIPVRLPEVGMGTYHDDRQQVLMMGRWPANNAWRTASGWSRLHATEVNEIVRRVHSRLNHPSIDSTR